MVRQSFRVGLRLGFGVGMAVAVVKSLQGRRDARELATPRADAWDPPAPPLPLPDTRPDTIVVGTAELRVEPEPGAVEVVEVVEVAQAEEPAGSWAEEPRTDDVLPAPADDEANRKSPVKPATRAWVEPTGAVCPNTHPVKAKLASGLFHLPGMLNYARTRPDRCYANEDAAVADGLTKAKR